MKAPCPRCGLELAGRQPHETPEDCLRHLAPRYQMAQQSLEHMHKRYRLVEERLERTQIALRVAKKAATRYEKLARKEATYRGTVPVRLAAVESALGLRKESERAAA